MRSALKPSPVSFPLKLPIRYRATSGEATVFGAGFTTSIGSKEIQFSAATGVREQMKIHLAIAWPILLEERTRLQLAVEAMIIDVMDGAALARVVQYHFRTRGDWEPVWRLPAAGGACLPGTALLMNSNLPDCPRHLLHVE